MCLSTDIIRFLTVRVDEHEQGPSPMMRRADRDEREGRGDRGDRFDRGDRGDRGDRRGSRRDRDRDRDFGAREPQAVIEDNDMGATAGLGEDD
jgi:small subunit ribosomal protein S6